MTIFQLSADLLDLVELAFVRGNGISMKSFEEFQPAWILVMSMVWLSLKQTIAQFHPNSGRVVGLIHAASCIVIGFPVLFLLADKSFSYADMFESFQANHAAILLTCNIMCYTSVGYFVMDSFLIHRRYLKHHIGTILVWLLAAYHHDTSLVHGVVVVALFETGAILVQCSRMFPNVLWFRFLVCVGYTSTRLSLAWYYGFIFHTFIQFYATCSTVVQLTYYPIFASLLFLLAINAKWTCMQWKALYKSFTVEGLDFYSYHQKIIGNTA